ncbi:MAG: VWA domain-containing protein [Acidobacteriota bacterium]
MNKLAIAIIFSAFAAFSALGQATTTVRPRVASTPKPPVLTNETVPQQQTGRPPVLIGGRNPGQPSATPTPKADDDSDVIKVETNLVTMPVSVLDRDGRFISGLNQNDFKIFENGTEQKIEYFQSVEQPFTVIMLIDVSPSTQFRIDEIQQAAITFIDQLRPSDRVMVIAFDEHVHVLSPITNNRNQLRDAIRETQFGDGTSLYEAVDFVIGQQLQQIQGRKAVVLFTDGVDTTSRQASFQSTVAETEEVDALFYTIRYDTSTDLNGGGMGNSQGGRRRGGGGRGGRVSMADILGAIITGGNVNMGGGAPGGASRDDYELGRKYLEALAQNSGGREFEASSMTNIDAAFSGIAEELRRQYSLGYYPDVVGKVGDRKQIKIRVMRPGVVVRAKSSYVVGQIDRSIAGK